MVDAAVYGIVDDYYYTVDVLENRCHITSPEVRIWDYGSSSTP
jgi:hypothetical protein